MFTKESVQKITKKMSGFLTWGNLRDLSVIAFIFICAYRLAVMDLTVDLSGFNFTDLLSMFLAISAIALSAAFYFKADESSQGFYNNTYHFTKDVSEILGRIEAGFGEKLRHIDEGYNGLNQKFDRMPFGTSADKSAELNKEAAIQEQEAERQNILEDLMRKADLADEEKRALVEKLSQLSDELDRSRADLAEYRGHGTNEESFFGIGPGFARYLGKFMDEYFPPNFKDAPVAAFQSRFKLLMADDRFDTGDLNFMERHGLVRNDRLTNKGVNYIKSLINKG